MKVFPFSNKFKSFIFSWFIARRWLLLSVSPSSALLMVMEAFQMKLLWNSWPPNYSLTAPVLPPKLSPSFLRPLLHMLCLEIFSSLLQKPSQIFHIIQQARITSSSLITMQFFWYHKTTWICAWQSITGHVLLYLPQNSLQKWMWPQDMRSFLSLPDETATHRAFPHLSSLGSAWR